MEKKIEFAHVVYKDDPKRFITVPIHHVKLKRNSENHITPTNDDDFNKKQIYYVAWRNCEDSCAEEHEHFGYYSAFVLLLGGEFKIIIFTLFNNNCVES